jgi:hypothetical protein
MVAWCDLQGPCVRWQDAQAMKLRKWVSSRAITRLCLVSPSQRSLYSSWAVSSPLPDCVSESASEWLLASRIASLPVLMKVRPGPGPGSIAPSVKTEASNSNVFLNRFFLQPGYLQR